MNIADRVRDRLPIIIAFFLVALAIQACHGVPNPKANRCRRTSTLSQDEIRECCELYNIACGDVVVRQIVAPRLVALEKMNVSDDPTASKGRGIGAGNSCLGLETIQPCKKGLKCREGICQKVKRTKAHALNTDSKKDITDEGIQLTGLSVPIGARVPIGEVLKGHVSMIKNVHQKLSTVVYPVIKNSVNINKEASNDGSSPDKADKSGDSTGQAKKTEKNETCPGFNAVGNSTALAEETIADGVENEEAATNLEETEDEQIADAVAKVVEKATGKPIDTDTLKELDSAVTRAMDKYEDKALAEGAFEVDVDDILAGISGSIKMSLPETETQQNNSLREQLQKIAPDERYLMIGNKLMAEFAMKLRDGVSPVLLERVAMLLIHSSKICAGNGEGNDGETLAKCQTVRWLRDNWFNQTPLAEESTPLQKGDAEAKIDL